jgi:hypothetical protein
VIGVSPQEDKGLLVDLEDELIRAIGAARG